MEEYQEAHFRAFMSSLSSEHFADKDILLLAESFFSDCPDELIDIAVIEFIENRKDVFVDFARKRLEKVKGLDLHDLLDSVGADITKGLFIVEQYEDKISRAGENLNPKSALLLAGLAMHEVEKYSDGIVLFSEDEGELSKGTVS